MEEYNQAILEQYKLYVEMADRISQRRVKSNQFYVSLLSGLLAIIAFLVHKDNQALIGNYISTFLLIMGILGIFLCSIWQLNIHSYRQINSKKFKVIHHMEKVLPFSPYTREYKLLGHSKDYKKYLRATIIERLIPMIMVIPYFLLVLFSIYQMTKTS